MEEERTWYDKFIEKLQQRADKEEFGSQNYNKILDVLAKVQDMKLKEDEALAKAYANWQRDEKEKKVLEKEQKALERELKSERKRFILDVLKIAAPIGGALLSLVLVMIFEQGGKIVPQRFVSWLIKPKI